jgi:hypothetical protein
MDLAEAERLIADYEAHLSQAYLIHFSRRAAGGFVGDYVPADMPFSTESEAWTFARKFAQATKETYFNIYVVDHHYKPVVGYREKMLNIIPGL